MSRWSETNNQSLIKSHNNTKSNTCVDNNKNTNGDNNLKKLYNKLNICYWYYYVEQRSEFVFILNCLIKIFHFSNQQIDFSTFGDFPFQNARSFLRFHISNLKHVLVFAFFFFIILFGVFTLRICFLSHFFIYSTWDMVWFCIENE